MTGPTAKLMIKLGKLHDAVHEEIEIGLAGKDFENIGRALSFMGFEPKIKWFRLRNTFEWKGVSVMLDRTRGYGNILELEKICDSKKKAAVLGTLESLLAELGVERTPKEVFDCRYAIYKKNWKRLV
ncbi:Uncharacterised protein [uncultured archaeon]|nr:Uncharacterised protein [uncultured archaeon]